MTKAESNYPELQLIDELISKLEAMIAESDESPLMIDSTTPPKRAFYRVLNAVTLGDRKPKTGEAIHLDGNRLVLYCNKTEIVRQAHVETTILAEKTGRGEALTVVKGKAQGIKRVRGGYEVDIEVEETRKNLITPGQKLRECLGKGDVAGWNRWCQDIRDRMDLTSLDLKNSDLVGYDLCCANLSGSDLTGSNLTNAIFAGADLTECLLDRVKVNNTDFFRARMRRNQAWVLTKSGMPEIESVLYEERAEHAETNG